jgi:hypothetical protein
MAYHTKQALLEANLTVFFSCNHLQYHLASKPCEIDALVEALVSPMEAFEVAEAPGCMASLPMLSAYSWR